MSAVLTPANIKILPSHLANQIAAGEVIERPASVIKELIENALDAGATRIDIDLNNGGISGIMVTDNGGGIVADELPLAISRHATSKIGSVEDLLNLRSLGFRGEALASMCSVSQWQIISRCSQSSSAASLSAQHPDQVVESNHAIGTSVIVNNLFYNTPARRKFLRAERTEFRHCEDVIKRMALARFDVGFYLKHNGKQTLRLPAVTDDIGRSRRVEQICGAKFISQSLLIDFPHGANHLWGWISHSGFSRQSTDLQFFYINGRVIRDRVIAHAIRIAYQERLPPGRHAVYVLHLDMDPARVDVNVHPTKHEVRFSEPRIVHDFISRSLRESLGFSSPSGTPVDAVREQSDITYTNATEGHLFNPLTHEPARPGNKRNETLFGQILSVIYQRFLLTGAEEAFYIIDARAAHAKWAVQNWLRSYNEHDVRSQPLLIPQRIELTVQQSEIYSHNAPLLKDLGVNITDENGDSVLLRTIPNLCSAYHAKALCLNLLSAELRKTSLVEQLENVLLESELQMQRIDILSLLSSIATERAHYASCWRELHESMLQDLILRSDHNE